MKELWSQWMEWAKSWPHQNRMAAISFRGTLSFWGHFLRSNDDAVVSKQNENFVVKKEKEKWTRILSMKYICHAHFFFFLHSLFRFIWQRIYFFYDRISLHRKGHRHTSKLEQVYSSFCGLLCISLNFILSCERKKIVDYSWL